jgi:Tfp pilus assembly protein PilF
MVPALLVLAAVGIRAAAHAVRGIGRPQEQDGIGVKGRVSAGVIVGVLSLGAVVTNVRPFGIDDRRSDPAFEMNHAFLLLERGECAQAIRAYESVVERNPQVLEAAYQLGRARQRCGDAAGAHEAYAAVSRQWPEVPYPYIERARLLTAAGDTADAEALVAAAIASAPSSPELRVALANLHLRRGDVASAASGYRGALALDPTRLSVWMNYGYTLVRLGELTAALEAFQRVLALDPTPEEAEMAQRNIDRLVAGRAHVPGTPVDPPVPEP